MKDMTYFKWSLSKVIRFVLRIFFLAPLILLTAIPAYVYDLCQELDYRLRHWWIE